MDGREGEAGGKVALQRPSAGVCRRITGRDEAKADSVCGGDLSNAIKRPRA